MQLADRLRLYLVADPDYVRGDLLATVDAALRGGVTAVQLRCKNRTDREFLGYARDVRALARSRDALFIVNDRVDIALACEADGVHLGVDDLPLSDARRIAGKGFAIGYSPETDEQTRAASASGADYLGVGPVYGTATKSDAGEAIGLETISRRAAIARIPVIGIGGITAGNARAVLSAGGVGVAVVSAISMQSDPEGAARNLSEALTT
jgi:thiamine-phosphate diphosphorylase